MIPTELHLDDLLPQTSWDKMGRAITSSTHGTARGWGVTRKDNANNRVDDIGVVGRYIGLSDVAFVQ